MKINKHKLILQTLLVISLVGSSLISVQISQFVDSINFNATGGSEWTFMFYLCGDNDLEEYAINIINELENGYDLSKNISILALIDRIPGEDDSNGDFTGCCLYQISPDKDTQKINSILLQDFGERDMGNGYNLKMLLNYGFENYTADHYFLSLYDHGGGLYGICYDDTSKTEYSTSNLKINEIKQAIDSAGFFNNGHIDVLCLAGCLMGEVEIAYELRTSVDYLIFSQNFGIGEFTNWHKFLESLNTASSLTPYNLSSLFVDAYKNTHLDLKDKTTCSVIDLNKLDELFNHIENFSNNLTLTLFNMKHITILNAREKASSFKYRYVDLIDFSKKLMLNITYMNEYPELKLSIEKLIENTQHTILFNYQNKGYIGSANGLSLYFLYPYSVNRGYGGYSQFSSSYDLEFIDKSNWVRFLHFLYSNDTDEDRLPDWFEMKYDLNHQNNDTDNNNIADNDEDFDSDLLDNWSEYLYGASPYKIDTDNDKMSDYQETRENEYNSYPFTWDSDLDDFSDKLEVTFLNTDPLDINDPEYNFSFFVFINSTKIVSLSIGILFVICIERRKKIQNKSLRNYVKKISKNDKENGK
ncbi:MAG: clostripain-related cysteine peptidase [Candidatus Heimdallarchaeota archaeon]